MNKLQLFTYIPYAALGALILWSLVCFYVIKTANRNYKKGYKTGYKDKEENKKSQY